MHMKKTLQVIVKVYNEGFMEIVSSDVTTILREQVSKSFL